MKDDATVPAPPWAERPTLDFDLSRPITQLAATLPPGALESGRRLLGAILAEIPPRARVVADWARLRTAWRFQREASGVARLIGANWREVILANLCYDLLLGTMGCSTVVLPTPSGPVVARNMDWWPEDLLARASYLIRCSRAGSFRFAQAGFPGCVGAVTGLSARGFAVVLNAVVSSEGRRWRGYPVLLHVRRVLEDASDFDDALRMLSRQRLAAPALFTLAGTRNDQRVVIERTPSRHALRRPNGDEPLLTTNDYRLLTNAQGHDPADVLLRTACPRYERLGQLMAKHTPDQEVADGALLYALSDEGVIQQITAQHVIMRPRSGEVRLFVPRRLLADDDSPGQHP
ncbi:MAG TPA: C45 family peptidase [Gemmataceae bacterium]|nr:C45 family peptidase [Gemmataceae bacterium]